MQAGTDHPLARLTGNINLPTATAQYYHQDGLGSVLATTNAAKAVTATQRFDAYGAKIGGTGTIPQYGYTGREPDASGLIYYRARYYDPNQVRFTQRDPLGYIDGLNRYSYVHNNPINFNDPNGLLANRVLTWADTQTTSYVNARSDLYADIGNQIATSYNNGVGQLPASISTPIQGFISGSQGQVNSTPSIANFLGNQARTGFYNVLDSVAPKIPGTDVRFAFGLGTKDVLMQNKANGATWETQVINNILPQTQTNIQPQISVKSNGPSGLKVRLDALGTSIDNGATMLSEMKSSPTAPLTPNQAIVFPELESYGGVVVGNGKTPYVGGTPIPPSVVNIFRKP
ncbi:RHS repeat-associated core domain-containing protein (plasmid) [Methylomonas sp. HW2-6]